jgi:hypothetical protein
LEVVTKVWHRGRHYSAFYPQWYAAPPIWRIAYLFAGSGGR